MLEYGLLLFVVFYLQANHLQNHYGGNRSLYQLKVLILLTLCCLQQVLSIKFMLMKFINLVAFVVVPGFQSQSLGRICLSTDNGSLCRFQEYSFTQCKLKV